MPVEFTLEFDYPEWLRNGAQPDVPANFKALMYQALMGVMQPFMEEVQGQTEYESIRSAYYLAEGANADGVTVELRNKSEIWPFRENDTAAHWPPWGPGTPLDTWAMSKGIPTFLVARKISQVGTQGNKIVQNTWPKYEAQRQQAIQAALYAFVLSGGTATTAMVS